ncbi:hypothetical protein JL722_2053 [Aureococcus anophagefferens]|nr:hypothetical protein JL722_2053 [Aureococcus anophagefferens]
MNIMESPATMMRRLRHAEDACDGRWADDAEEAANAAFAAMGAEVERRDAERERERSLAEVRRRERRAEHKWIKERGAELAAMRESDEARAAAPALPPRLETLDVADNDLARLFPECEALRTLVAAGNALTAADVAGAPFLTRLDLGSNQLAAVAGLGVLADLEVLELENRAWLRSDPDARPAANSVASLDVVAPLLHEPWPRLRELRVSGGGAALPTRIPASLRVLEARGCGLAILPAGDYAALERVDLEGNALEALPETWADLARLTRLRVGRNRLATLPERLNAVRDLGVDRNRLTFLPAAPRLEALDARGNRIGDAPSVLLSLDLSDNRVAALAPLPPTVAAVRLRNNRLLALPPLPASLELLVVDGNRLGAIPAAPKLRLLEATRNRLAALPELPALRVLAVAGNRLAALHLRASAQLSVVLAAENVVASVDLPATVRVLALFRNPAEAGASTRRIAAASRTRRRTSSTSAGPAASRSTPRNAWRRPSSSAPTGAGRATTRSATSPPRTARRGPETRRRGVAAANLDRAALVHERARRTDWLPLGLDLRGRRRRRPRAGRPRARSRAP